jgi:hypothetical protein
VENSSFLSGLARCDTGVKAASTLLSYHTPAALNAQFFSS